MLAQAVTITETEWGLQVEMHTGETVNDANILPSMAYVVGLCKEKGRNRLLIDATRGTRQISPLKSLEMVQVLKQLGGGNVRIAFVAPNYVGDADSTLLEQAGENRAISMRHFPDRKAALDWLLEK
jgi:hypothetical protein